jgi:8-hydroxy-5-deazaflavin:NADPH oxidoreductase
MKTTIAVIGATGNMGKGISRRLIKAGFRTILMGRNEEKLNKVVDSLKADYPNADIDTISCATEASWEADIIITAVPYSAQKDVAEKIKDVVTGKIVINLINPFNESYDALVTDPGISAAEEMQALLPHAKVVKAFNTVFAADFYQPTIAGSVADCFVAADDISVAETVADVVKASGFNPLIAGNLSASRTLENMMVILIHLTLSNKYNWFAGWKILHE